MSNGTMLGLLLLRLVPSLKDHLSDKEMADFFGEELSLIDRWIAKRHLANCWCCRGRLQYLKGPRAAHILQMYSETTDSLARELPEKPRAALAAWLEQYTSVEGEPEQRRLSLADRLRLWTSPGVLVASLSFVVALSVGAFFPWPRLARPSVSAEDLLSKAAKWDLPARTKDPGFAYQKLEIKTGGNRLERAVYWDLRGKRRPRKVALTGADRQLKATLEQAGVDWDHPISAADYLAWHDERTQRADSVTRTGKHLLTLTTTTETGTVIEQSLTMRDTDFHPVARTLDFRDREHVEIAELDYKVLPWNAAEANLFEPLGSGPDVSSIGDARPSPIHIAEAPSSEQLDEAELAARLVLNQLHADTGEQIEIHRSLQEIDVEGLVETEERKHELRAQLATVPRVNVSIQSLADVKRTPTPTSALVQVEAVTMPDQPSALQMFLRQRGRSVDDSNLIAQRLFNTALTISQESEALKELQTRFRPNAGASVVVSATLADLIYSHHERLEAALKQERALLAELWPREASGREGTANSASLIDAAARNLALVKELTQTNVTAERKAPAICADLSGTADMIDTAARSVYKTPQENAVTNAKD